MIIALTASAFAEDRERCFEAGMDDYRSEDLAGALTGAAGPSIAALRPAGRVADE